jgi:aminoglycoside phosphotransferase (APT) family kinase protein
MTEQKNIEQFKSYVFHKMPEAKNIEIGFVTPIFGGASRQTFRIELKYTLNDKPNIRRIILRREFEFGIIETKTITEWEAYRAFYRTRIPVPKLIWLEEDPKWLGSPFFVMEEILNCNDAIRLFLEPPYNALREKIGEEFCRIMGTVPLTDPLKVGLEGKLEKPDPDKCWKRELDYWESCIDKDQLEPHPVVWAAIRWLRRNPPTPAQKVVIVHGDMRAGNFLFNEKGEIKAMLDWEMMHMGDPLEDLAWSLNRVWSWSEPDRLGLMLPREKAIKLWEETSGFKAEKKDLFWWEVMSSIKSMAVWISMNKIYATGGNTDAIICYGGMWAMDLQRRILIQQMRDKESKSL